MGKITGAGGARGGANGRQIQAPGGPGPSRKSERQGLLRQAEAPTAKKRETPPPLRVVQKNGRGRQLETGGLGAGSHDNIAEIQSHGVAVPLHGPCLWEKPREEGRMSEVRKNNTHPPTQF